MKFTFFLKSVRCSDGCKVNCSIDLSFEQLVSIISPSKLCKLLNASDIVFESDKPLSLTRRNFDFISVNSLYLISSGHSSKEPKKD